MKLPLLTALLLALLAALHADDAPKPAVKVTQELLDSIHVIPKLIFDPMPAAYGQKYLPFAMAASMESTKKGRLWTCWADGADGPNAYLVASYSDDQGKSWRDPVFVIDPQAQGLKMGTPGKLLLDERTNVSCPDIAQALNGDIYVHYDRERTGAAEILFTRFREEDVEAGKLISKAAALKNLVKSELGMNHGSAGKNTSAEVPVVSPLEAKVAKVREDLPLMLVPPRVWEFIDAPKAGRVQEADRELRTHTESHRERI